MPRREPDFHLSDNKGRLALKANAKPQNNSFKLRGVRHNYKHGLWGIIIPLILTLIEWPFREILTSSNILMFYLLGVFFVAIRFGFWPSILASLTNAAAFAYFFAPPFFSLAIDEPDNLAGLAVTLVVGGVTSKLAENVRHQARVAEEGERRASALYRLSKELAEARLESEIIEIGVRHLHAEFGLQNTFLFPNRKELVEYPDAPPLEISLQGADLQVARWVFQHGRMAGQGTDNFSDQTAVYMPLNGSTGIIGVLVLAGDSLRQIFLPEQWQLLNTFINQILHTLERARLAEQAKDVTLKMQAETLRNSLLSSISHDLRTPLATIIGAASSLETDVHLNEDSKRRLAGAINEEAQRMSELATKILEMARLEAGDVVLNRQWYSPEEIVGSALRRLDKKLKTRTLNVNMADGLTLIHVDAVLLQQVLVNLLDNAAKYSPEGRPIDISIETTPFDLSITVADHGPGIPEGFQQKVFDKFFRLHPESAQSGVGLGLSICRAIVEAHGGDIQVTNRSGGGAMFQLHLPFRECPPTIAPEEKELIL
jgi:two-component system sensor histidine kinase KdpD